LTHLDGKELDGDVGLTVFQTLKRLINRFSMEKRQGNAWGVTPYLYALRAHKPNPRRLRDTIDYGI
jgi:hypothetical protein